MRTLSWLSAAVLARPWRWLIGIAVCSLPFALAIPRLTLRTDGEALYPARSPVVEATRRDRELFRDPEAVIVLVATRPGGEGIFTPAGLGTVKSLHERIRTVPGVRSDDVVSLASLLDVTRSAEKIQITRFLDPPPATSAEAVRLRERLDRDTLYSGFLYGADGRSAALFVPLARNESRVATIRRMRATIADAESPSFQVRLTGPVVAETLLGEQILADLSRLVPLVVVVVAVALFAGVRSLAGAVIPLTASLFVLVVTFGSMAMCRIPLTIVTSVLPVLLMAMAITDQIHLLERFQAGFAAGLGRAAALARSLLEVGRPIVQTSLTTALGFLSFTMTSVVPMRHFGLFAALGLVLAMVFTFTLVPAALMVLPERWLGRPRARVEHEPRGLEAWAGRRPRPAALVAILLLVLSLGGLPGVRVQDSWVQNFSPRSDLAVSEGIFNREYRGSYRLDVTLESGADGFFKRPAGLRLVDSLERVLAGYPEVAGTRSSPALARAALKGVDPDRSLLALDERGLAQLFLLIEMSGTQDQLDRLQTPSGRSARIQCFVRGADYEKAVRLLDRVEALGAGLARRTEVRLRATGDLPVATEVVRATVTNQIRSVALTILGLALFLAVSFRSVRVAGILLLPVVTTTLVVFGGMGALGIPLGVATSMFAALAEGEGIDFSIHIASRFMALRRDRSNPEALRQTLGSVGKAVRWNGAALVAGCLVLCLSVLQPVRALGALLAVGLAVSYLMAFLLLPLLLLSLPAPLGAAPGDRSSPQ